MQNEEGAERPDREHRPSPIDVHVDSVVLDWGRQLQRRPRSLANVFDRNRVGLFLRLGNFLGVVLLHGLFFSGGSWCWLVLVALVATMRRWGREGGDSVKPVTISNSDGRDRDAIAKGGDLGRGTSLTVLPFHFTRNQFTRQ